MPRKESGAVPEGNSFVPHQNEFGSGQPAIADLYRLVKERFIQSDRYLDRVKSHFDQHKKKSDERMEMARGTNQRVASLVHNARQSRLVIEADVKTDKKTRERTDGAAIAVQAMHGDSFFTEPSRSRPDVLDQLRRES